MIPELIAWSILGSAAYGTYRLVADACHGNGPVRVQSPIVVRRRPRGVIGGAQPAVTATVRQAARNLQIGLMQVREAPDFRRAASYAAHAANVPLWFRQRQYHRFRSLLVEHLAGLLNEGVSTDSLLPGLVQLVSALGIAPFEADYLRTEAESRLTRQSTAAPDFGQRLREAQAAYRSRMRTLEAMHELDEEAREQLLEQEKLRFQEQLRAISGGDGPIHEP